MQTKPAVYILAKNTIRRISPVGIEKVYKGNHLPKSQVLSSE